MDGKEAAPFKLYKSEIRKRFSVSDYTLQIMWRHLPYKKRLPFVKEVTETE